MLKLNASYSKKVPAETEYSSQSYHACVEVEIPDGLTPEQLQSRIHQTFDLVRNSVEAELGEKVPSKHGQVLPVKAPSGSFSSSSTQNADLHRSASPKQLTYLLDLARQRGLSPQQIAAQCQVPTIQHLSKRQCSELIHSWRAA